MPRPARSPDILLPLSDAILRAKTWRDCKVLHQQRQEAVCGGIFPGVFRCRKSSADFQSAVSQVFNLLGSRVTSRPDWRAAGMSDGLPIANRRYSRLKI